jgi:hypothetical protein
MFALPPVSPSIHRPVRSRRGARRIGWPVLVYLAAAACEPDGAAVFRPDPRSPLGQDVTSAWLGVYEGTGMGTLAGVSVSDSRAQLTVRLDADSVSDPRCVRCLTVTLDTFFVLANVNPDSEVDLLMQYRAGGARRTLRLDRYSGGGGIGNVLTARLVIDTEGDGTNLEYLLERR